MNQEILETYFPGLVVKDEGREKCENYLKLKGIERYSSLYFALKSKTENEIDYELLSQHYRYDVKLRRALHKTISFIEIAMRAAINNAYFNQYVQLSKDRWMSELSDLFGVEYKPEQIVKRKIKRLFTDRNVETISLFELLENCDMHVLNSIFLLLDSEKQKEVFDNDFEHLKENLDALRELRNCVEHHQLLIIKPLKKTWSNGEWQTSLQANVQNAINLSPKNARKNLKKLLNSCLVIEESENRSEENTYQLLPAFKVYFEDVK